MNIVEKARQEGRVEGAKKELEKELEHYKLELDNLVKGLNKLKKKPAIKSNKFWASMLIASEIRRIEKRLVELEKESKGVN